MPDDYNHTVNLMFIIGFSTKHLSILQYSMTCWYMINVSADAHVEHWLLLLPVLSEQAKLDLAKCYLIGIL